ncbi:MAG: hypothetical protein MJ141_08725 [Clostridia bacterium]|nr:hypothetical protein [Clostridia bacterium]
MKKTYKWIALLLTIVMFFQIPVQCLAANQVRYNRRKYIKELVVTEASTYNEAKSELEKSGYQAVKGNLNRTLPTGVFLGYKTTEDPTKAITDIAAMNMQGKYSYGDYEAIMEAYREEITETIENFLPSLEEFQTNYDSGVPTALAVYETLNGYVNDDTGERMGDYFVDYDYSASSEKEMTNTLMQANAEIVLSMMTNIAMGADAEESTMVKRLTDLGPGGLEDNYAHFALTRAEAKRTIAAKYGDTADAVIREWNNFNQYLCGVESTLVTVDEDGAFVDVKEGAMETDYNLNTGNISAEGKELVETIADVNEAMSETEKAIAVSLYGMLSEAEYGDGTLLDFFKRPVGEVEKEEIYPLVDAMSEGQRAQLKIIGLRNTLIGGFLDLEEGEEKAEEAVSEAENRTKSVGAISIYQNVDRSIYEEGVAFTSAAVECELQTGESWLSKIAHISDWNGYWNTDNIVRWAFTGSMLVTFSTSTSVFSSLMSKAHSLRSEFNAREAKTDEIFGEMDQIKGNSDWSEAAQDEAERIYSEQADPFEIESQYSDFMTNNIRSMWASGIVMGVSFILLIVNVVRDIETLVDYYNRTVPVEEDIPHHLMTALETEYGEEYVYYKTVKDLNGEAADVNNHEGNKEIGWLVLYVTDDAAAGKPIMEDDLQVVYGRKNVNADLAFVHLFNEKAALALTNELYTGAEDEADGTFMLFAHDESVLTGSAVTGGVLAIIALAGAALGFAGGMLVSKFRKKKATAA